MEPTAPPSPTIIATQSGDMFNQVRGRFPPRFGARSGGLSAESLSKHERMKNARARARALPLPLAPNQPEILLLTDSDAAASPRSQGKAGARAAVSDGLLEALPSDSHLQPSHLRQPRRR